MIRAFITILLLFTLLILACVGKKQDSESETRAESSTVETVTVNNENIEINNVSPQEITEDAPALANTPTQEIKTPEPKQPAKPVTPVPEKPKGYQVYFLEIGSVNCIPCKMMQPIMKDIEDEYKGIVKVEFHDLMVDKEIGPKYRIRVMPTQVFLDADKKEFFRHEEFYPKEELKRMLDNYLNKQIK